MSQVRLIRGLGWHGRKAFFLDFQEHGRGGAGVAERAVMGFERDSEVGAEGGESVGLQAGEVAFRLDDGAKDGTGEAFPDPFEFGLEKAMVEFGAMGDKDGVA